jgi:hypothetical protein
VSLSSLLLPLLVSTMPALQGGPEPAILLVITSPASGTIVEPGQRLTVTVDSPTLREAQFAVLSPVGESDLVSSLPGRATLEIRKSAHFGKTNLGAMGITPTHQLIASNPVEIDVERSDAPIRISADMRELYFWERGASFPLSVTARFEDGSEFDVRESSRVTYTSSNSEVAEVNGWGLVTSMGVGDATVTIEYRIGDTRRAIEIPVEVPSLRLTVSPDALDFGERTIGLASPPHTLILKNTDTEPMKITAVHASGDFDASATCIGAAPLAVNGECVLSVTFTPSATGPRSSTIGVETDRTILPNPIRVTGIGVR